MRYDPHQMICGIAARTLREFLKRQGHNLFGTPEFMLATGLREPQASEALIGLSVDGYVEYESRSDGRDLWQRNDRGTSLVLAKTTRRITFEEAQAALERLCVAADDYNTKETASRRIVKMIVFGSALIENEDRTCGDLDVVAITAMRTLPTDRLDAIREAERRRAPESAGHTRVLFNWQHEMKAHLCRVTTRLSLMSEMNLDDGVAHAEFYAYDKVAERRIEPDRTVRRRPPSPPDAYERRPPPPMPPQARMRPTPPERPVEADMSPIDLATIEHMWARGETIRRISRSMSMPGKVIAAALWTTFEEPPAAEGDPLEIADAIARRSGMTVSAICRGSTGEIEVSGYSARKVSTVRLGPTRKRKIDMTGDPRHWGDLRAIARAFETIVVSRYDGMKVSAYFPVGGDARLCLPDLTSLKRVIAENMPEGQTSTMLTWVEVNDDNVAIEPDHAPMQEALMRHIGSNPTRIGFSVRLLVWPVVKGKKPIDIDMQNMDGAS